MGYWGWRPLIFGLVISTWVVGCNMVSDTTSSSTLPSAYPHVTLTVGRLSTARAPTSPTHSAPTHIRTSAPSATPSAYVIRSGDTLAEIAARFKIGLEALIQANDNATTLIPGETLLIPVPTPLPLLIQPPTCTETHPGTLLCLGRVDNPLAFPVESVAVEVSLLQSDGSVSASESSTLEQTSIPAGSFAPYQAIFAADWDSFVSADASLISAEPGTVDRFVPLLIENLDGEQIDGRLIVSAVIDNPGGQDAELLRAIITLTDVFGQVIGYRVVSFDTGLILNAGERLPLRVEVAPPAPDMAPDTALDYALYVEARAKEG